MAVGQKWCLFFLVLLSCNVSTSAVLHAKDFLFQTIESSTPAVGSTQHTVHFTYLDSPSIAETSYAGYQVMFPVYSLSIALGKRAEMWIKFPAYQYLNAPAIPIDKADGGDPEFYTKIRFLNEQGVYPAMSFVYGFKEAATNPPLGTDEHDVFGIFTLSKSQTDIAYHMNIGVGILGNTRNSTDQAHTMLLNTSLLKRMQEKFQLGLELVSRTRLAGQWFQLHTPVHDALNRASLSFVGRYQIADNQSVGLKMSLGLIPQSEKVGITLGYEYKYDP